MEAALNYLLPKLLDGITFRIICFQSKHDLLNNATQRLRGYASWLPLNYRILVLVDRDDDECKALKQKLEHIAASARLLTKTAAGNGQSFHVINRIVIEELEAWYFGDWAAVKVAYPRVPDSIPRSAAYRDPDAITGGTWEALERVLKKAGYFKTGLRKLELARSVAPHMNVHQNSSQSFQSFASAVALR